jgi:hypothetical protein
MAGVNTELGPFECAFCDGQFTVDVGLRIIHTLPTCKEYDNLKTLKQAVRFIRLARLALN